MTVPPVPPSYGPPWQPPEPPQQPQSLPQGSPDIPSRPVPGPQWQPQGPPPDKKSFFRTHRQFILPAVALVAVIFIGLVAVLTTNQSSGYRDGLNQGSDPATAAPTTTTAPVNETPYEKLGRVFNNYWVDDRPGSTPDSGDYYQQHGAYLVLDSPYSNLDSFLSDLGASPSVYTNMTTTWHGTAVFSGYMIEWNTYTTNTIGVNQIRASIIVHSP